MEHREGCPAAAGGSEYTCTCLRPLMRDLPRVDPEAAERTWGAAAVQRMLGRGVLRRLKSGVGYWLDGRAGLR